MLGGSASAGEWCSDSPTLPLFFSLGATVKADPRLLLRHAGLDGGAEASSGSWADLAVKSSSCWLGGALWMLFGWRAGRQAAGGSPAEERCQQQEMLPPTMPGAAPPTGGLAAAGQAGTPGHSQPASPLAGAGALARPAADAGSGEWTLGAAAAPPAPPAQPTLAEAAATLERLAAEAAAPAPAGGLTLAARLAPAAGSSAESVEAGGGGQITPVEPEGGVLGTAFWWENM